MRRSRKLEDEADRKIKIPVISYQYMENIHVGLDVHKKTIQICVIDMDGTELLNKSIQNTPKDIESAFLGFPKGTRMAIESSSIWKAPFFQLRDKMGFDVILSNPYANRLIAQSKKKTDKIDAKILADLYRGGYLVECHIPSKKAMENRDLTRHRLTLVRQRTSLMNNIHGMLLQNAILPKGRSFSISWIAEIRKLGDYRRFIPDFD